MAEMPNQRVQDTFGFDISQRLKKVPFDSFVQLCIVEGSEQAVDRFGRPYLRLWVGCPGGYPVGILTQRPEQRIDGSISNPHQFFGCLIPGSAVQLLYQLLDSLLRPQSLAWICARPAATEQNDNRNHDSDRFH